MTNRRPFVLIAAAALLLALSPTRTLSSELWVVLRDTRSIARIDTDTLALTPAASIADPDANSIPDSPWGISFSTTQAEPGTHAFITQERLVVAYRVSDLAVVRVVDLGAILGLSGLDLRGCDTTVVRRMTTGPGGAPVLRAYVVVVGNDGFGGSIFAVFDQDAMLSPPPAADPLVDHGVLAADAEAVDVKVLNTPSGDRYLRAWATARKPGVLGNGEIRALLLAAGSVANASWSIVESRSYDVGLANPPTALRPGSPLNRELPVMPLGTQGRAINLDTGGDCDGGIGSSIVAAEVSGVGPNAYTLHLLDQANEEVLVMNPRDCTYTPLSVGSNPVALEVLGECSWKKLFALNQGDDTVSVYDFDANPATVNLSPVVLGGGGFLNAVDMGVAGKPQCKVEDWKGGFPQKNGPDILLEWNTDTCVDGATVKVLCSHNDVCTDPDPLQCPCYCDSCDNVSCFCGDTLGVGGAFEGGAPPIGNIQGPFQPPIAGQPWIILGNSDDGTFVFSEGNVGDHKFSFDLAVTEDP